METIAGFLAPVMIYFFIFILNAILPGRWVSGYVTKENSSEKLRYRLNGLVVLFVVVITWLLLCYFGFLSWDWLYQFRWYGLAGAVVSGLIFSLLIVVPYPAVRKWFIADFFFGRLANPQLWGGRVDAKMCLYLVGAIMLELNVLSFAAHHFLTFGHQDSISIYITAGLLTYFVIDYLTFEEVHLYTYDFFAERVGFKLGWGCIAFYPYFYSVPLWATVGLPGSADSTVLQMLFILVFFAGWILARGANMQKYYFKKYPEKSFIGIAPEVISDEKNRLLVSGFWGLSRHINYLGEILMATGIVLSAGHPDMIWPWLYPLYYVLLLFTRQMDDDRRCALKYGALWDEYLKKVPYRIIPYLY
jgi:delta14-sterol reductase